MHIWDDKFGHQTFRYKKYAYIKNRGGTFISLHGDRLKRITKWEKGMAGWFCKRLYIRSSEKGINLWSKRNQVQSMY